MESHLSKCIKFIEEEKNTMGILKVQNLTKNMEKKIQKLWH